MILKIMAVASSCGGFFIHRLFYVLPNPLNRITAATDNTRRFGLSNVKYDKNGNITHLTRGGHLKEIPDWDKDDDFGTMDQLDYQYFDGSNRLRSVTDGILKNDTSGKGEFVDGNKDGDDYVYDPNGNMTQDLNKGIKGATLAEKGIEYNHLNLPTLVRVHNGADVGTISYIYDATGVKLRKNVLKQGETTPTATDYAGNYVYENGTLQFFSTPEGYATSKNVNDYSAGFDYVYNYVDHLGNVRLSYMHNNGTVEIVKESNYYPFGLSHKGYNEVVSPLGNSVAKKYMFGGKEYQDDGLDLGWYDVTARNYDPALGRWMNLDPLAEQMRRHSPYNFGFDNPIYFQDYDGMSPCPPGVDCAGIVSAFKRFFGIKTPSVKPINVEGSGRDRSSSDGYKYKNDDGQPSGDESIVTTTDGTVQELNVTGLEALTIVAGGKKAGKGDGITTAKDPSKKNPAVSFADGVDRASDAGNSVDAVDNVPDGGGSLETANKSEPDSTEVTATREIDNVTTTIFSNSHVSSTGGAINVKVKVPTNKVDSVNNASKQASENAKARLERINQRKLDSLNGRSN